jgi:outer membrane protein assembly factor BamA
MATARFGTSAVHVNENWMKQNAFYDSLSALGRFRFWRPLSAATILIVLGIFASGPAFSQSSPAAELHVKDIQVQGNQLIPSEWILRALKTEKGDIFFRDQLVQDLKAINKLGWFDEYGSHIDPQLVDGAIVLRVVVEENPTVKRIVFKGNKDVSEKELLPIFEAQLGKPQNIEMIGKAIDKIEKNFRDQGYVLARVVDLKDSGNGNCIVVIDEGVVGEVEITGGETLKGYLQKHIKIKPGQIYNDRTLSNDLKDMQADGFFMVLRRSLSASVSDPSRYKLTVEQVYNDAPLVVAKGHAKPVFTATGAFAPAANSNSRPFKESSNGTNVLLERLKRQRSL